MAVKMCGLMKSYMSYMLTRTVLLPPTSPSRSLRTKTLGAQLRACGVSVGHLNEATHRQSNGKHGVLHAGMVCLK